MKCLIRSTIVCRFAKRKNLLQILWTSNHRELAVLASQVATVDLSPLETVKISSQSENQVVQISPVKLQTQSKLRYNLAVKQKCHLSIPTQAWVQANTLRDKVLATPKDLLSSPRQVALWMAWFTNCNNKLSLKSTKAQLWKAALPTWASQARLLKFKSE